MIKPAPVYEIEDPGTKVTHYAFKETKPFVVLSVRRFWSHFGSWITERYLLEPGDWS